MFHSKTDFLFQQKKPSSSPSHPSTFCLPPPFRRAVALGEALPSSMPELDGGSSPKMGGSCGLCGGLLAAPFDIFQLRIGFDVFKHFKRETMMSSGISSLRSALPASWKMLEAQMQLFERERQSELNMPSLRQQFFPRRLSSASVSKSAIAKSRCSPRSRRGES